MEQPPATEPLPAHGGNSTSQTVFSYVDNDEGLVIMGVQVRLNSDQKALWKSLFDSRSVQTYSQLADKVREARGERGDVEISPDNIRKIMEKVKRAFRDAFPNSTVGPIENVRGEVYGRFRLNPNWFIENVRRLNEENHS